MSLSEPLPAEWSKQLLAKPETYCPLQRHLDRVIVAGTYVPDEVLEITDGSTLHLRPDRLPPSALNLSMVHIIPIYSGLINVGWVFKFPALHVDIHRNYINIARRRNLVFDKKDEPQLVAKLNSLIVLEIPDTLTMLLSTKVSDMRT